MHRHEYDDVRFRVFHDEVLSPAVVIAQSLCDVAVWQTTDHVTADEAISATFQQVPIGWRWGPVWSTAWFQVRGSVPDGDGTPALSFSSGTEALLWQNGTPWHGLDANHDLVVLPQGGQQEFLIEAACNLPLGVSTFWWDEVEVQARWKEALPGRLEHAACVRIDESMQTLCRRWTFVRLLAQSLPRDSDVAQRLSDALHEAMALIPDTDPRSGVDDALSILECGIHSGAPSGYRCTAIGHAHIDTAWLWTLDETRRKCARTFATMLRLMERRDAFVFLCSQTQQYAWMESAYPKLFAGIADRVQEGRWQADGGMWIEPDCLVPSGESLIRQILQAHQWWTERFGDAGEQRLLYLPDTFGFAASLPQIARHAGLDTFITNKIAWNETNHFPHVSFTWRGIDGTDIVSHMTPGHNYNSRNEPNDLLAAQRNITEQDHGRVGDWLHPFGFGDGGGGPTEAQIDRVQDSADAANLPRTQFDSIDAFCDRLHDAGDLPVWDGELYLEMHRGIYTSQAWLKRANLQLEESLRVAELVSPTTDDTVSLLDASWKTLLLHQFHDILPGSSIAAVYDQARDDMAATQDCVDALVDRELGNGEAIFNPASTPRSGVVQVGDELRWADGIPPLASGISTPRLPASVRPVECDDMAMDNGLVSFRVSGCGCIKQLRCCDTPLDVATDASGWHMRLSELRLYEDRPRQWDAWNLDHDYQDKPIPLDRPTDIRVVESSPLRAVIEVHRSIGDNSRGVLRYSLDAGARRVNVHATIDWHEDHRVLRANFPTSIRARTATCGIQFGCLERPTHRNTSWEQAQFEVPGHRWTDLSEPGRGLAVLDRAIYGRSIHHGTLGLTLLRASGFPDPNADRGTHQLHWALMPHIGDWRYAGVDAEAETLTRPLRERTSGRGAPFGLETIGPVAVEIAAVKPTQRGGARVIRLVEKHGGHGTAVLRFPVGVGAVVLCDGLERPLGTEAVVRDGGVVRVGLRPFGIVSIRVENAS